jgi:hypothetical protein
MNQYYKENLSSVKLSFMKKSFLIIVALLSIVEMSFSQVKIINATNQKTFGGMGGITMKYFIEFRSNTSIDIVIDSVKSISDRLRIEYDLTKNDKGYYVINFRQSLKKSAKCATCRDVNAKQSDVSKGVIIYYKKSNKKSASFKVKKFTPLPDVTQP